MSAWTVGILIVSLIASVVLWIKGWQAEREIAEMDRRTKKLEELMVLLTQPRPADNPFRTPAERTEPPPIRMPGPGRERLG